MLIKAIRLEDLTDEHLFELKMQNPHDNTIETYFWWSFSEDPKYNQLGRSKCVVMINRSRLLQAAEISQEDGPYE